MSHESHVRVGPGWSLATVGDGGAGGAGGVRGTAGEQRASRRRHAGAPAAWQDGVTAPTPEFGPPPSAPPPERRRDVVKTASMTITVANTSEAADKAAVLVEKADGRVDSRSEDAGSQGGFARTRRSVLRVPVAKLDGLVRELKILGKVQTAETRSEDVTAQRVDLDARMKALQTSVDRLLGIMRDAKDPDALINAESALSQRQADLDSLRAQREAARRPNRLQHGRRHVRRRADRRTRAEAVRGIHGPDRARLGWLGFGAGQRWFCSSVCCCRGWACWSSWR